MTVILTTSGRKNLIDILSGNITEILRFAQNDGLIATITSPFSIP
jgi:hypothetical protein